MNATPRAASDISPHPASVAAAQARTLALTVIEKGRQAKAADLVADRCGSREALAVVEQALAAVAADDTDDGRWGAVATAFAKAAQAAVNARGTDGHAEAEVLWQAAINPERFTGPQIFTAANVWQTDGTTVRRSGKPRGFYRESTCACPWSSRRDHWVATVRQTYAATPRPVADGMDASAPTPTPAEVMAAAEGAPVVLCRDCGRAP